MAAKHLTKSEILTSIAGAVHASNVEHHAKS